MTDAILDQSEAIAVKHKQCFHCGLDIPPNAHFSVLIDQVDQPVCCPGCKAAAEFIQQSGLTDFYQYRGDQLPENTVAADYVDWSYYDQSENIADYHQNVSEGMASRIYINGMYCSSCAWLIDCSLSKLPGVSNIQINPDSHQLQLLWSPKKIKFSLILSTLARLGYQPRPLKLSESGRDSRILETREALKRLAIAGFGMMQVMTYAVGVYLGDYQGMDAQLRQFLNLVSMLVATAVVFYAGAPFFKHAWFNLKHRYVGMDVPVALAIGGAYAASVLHVLFGVGQEVYFDSAVMFIFFLSLGRFVEMRARYASTSSAYALQQLLPPLVKISRNNEEMTLPPENLLRGDYLTVSSGETIPCDALVVNGKGKLDESMLTGESRLITRSEGSRVTGGSLLKSGELQLMVSHDWQHSVVASIKKMLDAAQARRPHQLLLADRLARYFVVAVLLIAAITAGYWYWYAPDKMLPVVLSVLIATCPCAFSLATPTALSVASDFLSRHGVLLCKPEVLETVLTLDDWCFDKTGTLTNAGFKLKKIKTFNRANKERCMRIITAMEQHSDHIIATAFAQQKSSIKIDQITHVPGSGIQANIGGEEYYLGNRDWVYSFCDISDDVEIDNQHTLIVLAKQKRLLAFVYLSAHTRDEAPQLLTDLYRTGRRIHVLSGDRQSVVSSVCADLSVDVALGDLLPEDKLSYIERLQLQGKSVAMVGDGVNDAPVLEQANVSFAMASGSELSQSHADVILMHGKLQGIRYLQQVATRSQQVIRQNLLWAASYNLSVLPLAVSGMLAPWMAAIGMSLSSLLVVLNARRISRIKLRQSEAI